MSSLSEARDNLEPSLNGALRHLAGLASAGVSTLERLACDVLEAGITATASAACVTPSPSHRERCLEAPGKAVSNT